MKDQMSEAHSLLSVPGVSEKADRNDEADDYSVWHFSVQPLLLNVWLMP